MHARGQDQTTLEITSDEDKPDGISELGRFGGRPLSLPWFCSSYRTTSHNIALSVSMFSGTLFMYWLANHVTGGGHWQPDAAALSKLRQDIDRKPHKIKAVLTNEHIRKAFLGGVQDNEKKAVKAFTSLTSNQSTALKRNPKVSLLSFVRSAASYSPR